MATGTDLEIIHAQLSEIAGSDAERLPSPETDRDLLAVWLRSHIDGSPHKRRAYKRIGGRFLEALEAAGGNLGRGTVDDVQTALEALRVKENGSPASAATVNTQVAVQLDSLSLSRLSDMSR